MRRVCVQHHPTSMSHVLSVDARQSHVGRQCHCVAIIHHASTHQKQPAPPMAVSPRRTLVNYFANRSDVSRSPPQHWSPSRHTMHATIITQPILRSTATQPITQPHKQLNCELTGTTFMLHVRPASPHASAASDVSVASTVAPPTVHRIRKNLSLIHI